MKETIRKTILCTMLILVGIAASAQVKEFERYSNAKNMTYTYISSYMLNLAGKATSPSLPGVNTKALRGKLSGIQIISSDDPKASARLKSNTQAFVGNERYELLMQLDEDSEKVRIYYRKSKQQSVVVMMSDMDGEVSVIVFSGSFTLDDVMKLRS
ncbi:MAG: DUF4252 domain-containing protein [Bacteroidaceae bacterium]|nr:DUF4252 domain-containing protein [Bacteroidaceae bacterium]